MLILSSEQRFALYYAALFSSIGSIGPFMAVWLNHAGVSTSMIGVIMAAPSILMLFTTIKLGRWADSLVDRRSAIITGNWIILVVHLLLFVHTGWWLVLLVWSISGVIMYAKVPVTDAAALSLTHRNGSDFAQIRLWGSVGFIVAITLAGYVYERWGIALLLGFLLAGNLLRLSLAYCLPRFARPVSGATDQCDDAAFSASSDSLYQPGILLTLAGASLINASHAMFNTFGILNWTQQGLSEFVSSLAIATGVVSEICLMWRFRSLTHRFSARGCLLVAAGCGVLRWSVLASNPAVVWIFAAQLLHAVTFALMYLATASFIAKRVSEADAARGQSLSATMATACMAAGTFITGWQFEQWGASFYWVMAMICIAGAALLGASYLFALDD